MEIEDCAEGEDRMAGLSLGSHLNLPPPAAPALGMEIDATNPASVRNLCAQVVLAALDSSWANWSPKGEFIAPNIVFAMGAVNWNEFWVKKTNNTQGPAYMQATNFVGGAAPAVNNPRVGENQYIPPEKFYFPSNNSPNDTEMDRNGKPYGLQKCTEYRNAMRASFDAGIKRFGTWVNAEYEHCTRNFIMYDPAQFTNQNAAGTYLKKLATQEQAKVASALLFQSVC